MNYTQQEISDYLGISQPAYVKYEKGETVVPLEAMEKLASLYNVEEYDLMEENDQLFQTSVACAYRKTGNVGDLSQISQFQKIVKIIFRCVMSLKSKVELECLATRLREEMHVTTKDPVRIHQILKEKHILTWFKKLDKNFSGMAIRINGNGASVDKYFMLINTALPYAKQRFTACHELYHLLYQKDFKVSQNNAGLFDKKEEEEYNADVFAAYLLLPEMGLKELVPAVEQQVDKITLATLLKVEQNFLCSRAALLTRLKELKWITKKTFDLYKNNVVNSAIEYGYNTQLYYPTYQTELVGDYNLKARELYDMGRISQAKYYSLLMDMEINVSQEVYGEE